MVRIHNGILATEKEWNTAIAATQMDLESVILSEVSQRRRNIIWHPLYMKSKTKWYKWTYTTEKYSQTEKRTYGCQGEW